MALFGITRPRTRKSNLKLTRKISTITMLRKDGRRRGEVDQRLMRSMKGLSFDLEKIKVAETEIERSMNEAKMKVSISKAKLLVFSGLRKENCFRNTIQTCPLFYYEK